MHWKREGRGREWNEEGKRKGSVSVCERYKQCVCVSPYSVHHAHDVALESLTHASQVARVGHADDAREEKERKGSQRERVAKREGNE